MAEFYSRTQGSRGEATRIGTKNSGIRATVESWGSVVSTRMFSDETARSGHGSSIAITDKNGNQTGIHVYLDTDSLAVASRSGDPVVERAIQAVNAAVENLDEAVSNYFIEQDETKS